MLREFAAVAAVISTPVSEIHWLDLGWQNQNNPIYSAVSIIEWLCCLFVGDDALHQIRFIENLFQPEYQISCCNYSKATLHCFTSQSQ